MMLKQALFTLLLASCALDDANLDTTSQDVTAPYTAIRAQEANFPLPTPSAEVVIGTYDAYYGTWSGLTTTTRYVTGPNGKPMPIPDVPSVNVNAVASTARIDITNRGSQALSLTVNGVTVSAPAGQSYVEVDARLASNVKWALTVGAHTRSDQYNLTHPFTVGAGVLTVPALPISVVYAPPQQDPLKLNYVNYSTLTSISSSLTASFAQASSTTKGAEPIAYASLGQLNDSIAALKTTLSFAPDVPNKSAIESALSVVSSAVGDVSATQTEGTTDDSESSLTVSDVDSQAIDTGAHMGPGDGDRIVYLTNVSFVWLCDRGNLTIAILGFDGIRKDIVTTLESDLAAIGTSGALGPTTHLSADSLHALLALDPFVAGGAAVTLDSKRFVPGTNYASIAGTTGSDDPSKPDVYSVSHAVTSSDKTSHSGFATDVTDERAGWLAFAGVGVTDDAKITMSTTDTQSANVVNTSSVTTNLYVFDQYDMNVYYDTVFGGFAFQAPSSRPIVLQ